MFNRRRGGKTAVASIFDQENFADFGIKRTIPMVPSRHEESLLP
jgi:hypothetical protein